jgi:anti-anti-sigma factor
MPTSSCEVINGVLFVTGSLDRSSDGEFQKALEKYAETVPATERVVDMSNVRWLAPTGAKVLIQAGQDAQEKNGKLRVLASRHVMQTLSLLGAKTWLTIETVTAANKMDSGVIALEAAKMDAPPPAATPAAPAAKAAPEKAADAPAPVVAPAAAAPAVSSAAASGSGLSAVGRPGALAGPAEELSGGAHLLRVLYPNRRYTFHFGNNQEIIGIVRERVGGSWILIETHGTRKIINLDVLEYCEIL